MILLRTTIILFCCIRFIGVKMCSKKWWRPSHPPETYLWEEVRRKRKKGGYPWTLLDKEGEEHGDNNAEDGQDNEEENENENDIDFDDFLDDNLYEPVNPPPLYGTGSTYMAKDKHETGSLDGRMIDIPPEIEIVNSEGLDGLDQPDPHDHGFDGDKEWMHSDDEHGSPPKVLFTAGIRRSRESSTKDTPTSRVRPLTNKGISFSPDTADSQIEGEESEEPPQQVPSSSSSHHVHQRGISPSPKRTTTAFEILKSKAAGWAGPVKQRLNKIALPVRPKFNQWEGVKLARKKSKKKVVAGAVEPEEHEQDQEIRDEEFHEQEVPDQEEPMEEDVVQEFPFPETKSAVEEEPAEQVAASAKEIKEEAIRKEKEAAAEEKQRKLKEQEELKRQKAEEKQKAKDEAQKAKDEAQKVKEELQKKKAEEKAEEKAAKQKIADEAKKAAEETKKAAEEAKQKAAEETKKAAEEAKQKAAEETKKAAEEAKKVKLEEQLAKARDAEEQRRVKEEETVLQLKEAEEAKQSAPHDEEIIENVEEENLEQEVPTPTGTGTRKKRVFRRPQLPQLPQMPHLPQLPQLPHMDDFRKKFKRSKTPPSRPKMSKKGAAAAAAATENQLAAQYASEIEARKLEMEQEDEPQASGSRLHEPQIYITQPSVEPLDEDWRPSSSTRSDEMMEKDIEESAPGAKKQPAAKETFDKTMKNLKGFGIKSKAMASQRSKEMGQKMKVIGKDLQKFGVKINDKYQSTIEEIKSKQEAAKARTKQKAKEAEDIDDGQMEEDFDYTETGTEPRRKFRFRRRDDSQEESEDAEHKASGYYENQQEARATGSGDQENRTDEARITRSQLLGRADRDWESPLDLAQSRDVSEEPFSGISSRDSPPGSSMASSTFAHVRKQGVLEEIDSDEFFLREKGISEGEDEEEINRFLVEELRQAFRPTMSNALAGFDLPAPPERPERLPRKPPRKDRGDKSPTYQTFPPERPRRKTPGYVSAYMNEQQDGGEEENEEQGSNEEERGSPQEDLEDYDDEGVQTVKEELNKVEQEEMGEQQQQTENREEYEDDGRYEPISEEPVKPQRTKRRQKQQQSTPLYYNTVAGNEWMRDIEDQVQYQDESQSPKPPQRERNKSSKSRSLAPDDETEIHFADDEVKVEEGRLSAPGIPLAQAESEGRIDDAEVDLDDDLEYVDEAGYAVVHKDKDPPRTVPRRKKKSGGSSKGNSLKRRSPEQQAGDSDSQFFSLPHRSQRTAASHIVPPSRPQRAYSTLKPRRPPRHKSNQNLGKAAKPEKDDGRPSTAIGIMQGRPLPAPPRPQRSPAPLNDLDQTTIERAVGARHYANFGDNEIPDQGVAEEVFTATNIPVLGRDREEERSSTTTAIGDINIGIQTDPLQEDEFEIEAAIRSFVEDSSRVTNPSDSVGPTSFSYDRDAQQQRPRSPAPPKREQPPQQQQQQQQSQPASGSQQLPPQFVFPRRLHLDELEVNILRVNDLSAHSITVEHLNAPQLEVNSLTSIGPLSMSSIHTQTLTSDQIMCNRLSSDTVDLPSVPPPSFFNLSSPEEPISQEKPKTTQPQSVPAPPEASTEELRLEMREKEEAENESACLYPQDPVEDFEDISNPEGSNYTKDSTPPPDELIRSSNSEEFCMTPEQSAARSEHNWEERSVPAEDFSKVSEVQSDSPEPDEEYAKYSEDPEPTDPYEDFAKYSEDQYESSMPSEDFLKSTEDPSQSQSQSFIFPEEDIKPEQEDDEEIEEEYIKVSGQILIDTSEPSEIKLVIESLEEQVQEEPSQASPSNKIEESSPPDIYDNAPSEAHAARLTIAGFQTGRSLSTEEFIRTLEAQVEGSVPSEKHVTLSSSQRESYEIMDEPIPQDETVEEEEIIIAKEEKIEEQHTCPIISSSPIPEVEASQPFRDVTPPAVIERSNTQFTEVPQSSTTTTTTETVSDPPSPRVEAPRPQTPEREEDVIQLSIRLGRALARLTMRALHAMIDYVDTATSDDPAKAEQQKAHMQVLLCVLLMLIAGILLSTRSGPTNPRWEFLMPPPDL